MSAINSVQGATSTVAVNNTSASSNIDQQIKALQQQITTEQQSNDDAKTKQAKIQALEQEIAQLELLAQIRAQTQVISTQSASNTSSTSNKSTSSVNAVDTFV